MALLAVAVELAYMAKVLAVLAARLLQDAQMEIEAVVALEVQEEL